MLDEILVVLYNNYNLVHINYIYLIGIVFFPYYANYSSNEKGILIILFCILVDQQLLNEGLPVLL